MTCEEYLSTHRRSSSTRCAPIWGWQKETIQKCPMSDGRLWSEKRIGRRRISTYSGMKGFEGRMSQRYAVKKLRTREVMERHNSDAADVKLARRTVVRKGAWAAVSKLWYAVWTSIVCFLSHSGRLRLFLGEFFVFDVRRVFFFPCGRHVNYLSFQGWAATVRRGMWGQTCADITQRTDVLTPDTSGKAAQTSRTRWRSSWPKCEESSENLLLQHEMTFPAGTSSGVLGPAFRLFFLIRSWPCVFWWYLSWSVSQSVSQSGSQSVRSGSPADSQSGSQAVSQRDSQPASLFLYLSI